MAARLGGFGCGRRAAGGGGPGVQPFVLPGTEPRYAPDRRVDVEHLKLEIEVDPRVPRVAGRVTHRLRGLLGATRRVGLHAGEMRIGAVRDGAGRALSFVHAGEDLSLDLAEPLAAGQTVEVEIDYAAEPRRGLYFVAPDAAHPHKRPEAWTQGQDEDSRYWFPCFDHPSEKATSEVVVQVPDGYVAVSNGVLVGRAPGTSGHTVWHWRLDHPHSAYLVMLAVGEYEMVDLGRTPVPLDAYVPPGLGDRARRALGRTGRMMELFARRFGVAYPYERYAQVVVQDFIFGGMENTSATTLLDLVLYDDRAALDFDLDALVAHELAHQWWGDLLTCRDWHHAWLNEGFATWAELLWREEAEGPDAASHERREMAAAYLREAGEEYRRAIVDRRYDEPIDLFDRHLYEKGALVLHTLRRELGEEGFFASLAAYARAHRGRSVATDDLVRAVADTTGRDLDWFFEQWVGGVGHPELKVATRHDPDAGVVRVRVEQRQTGEGVPPAFRLRTQVLLGLADGSERREEVVLTRREQDLTVAVAAAPRYVVLDPEGDLLAEWQEDVSVQGAAALLASAAPLAARVRAAAALGRDGSAPAVAALGAALGDAAAFWSLRAAVARALGEARTAAARDALVAALAQEPHPKARRAVAEALGAFRHDAAAADALAACLKSGDPSYFVEAAAARALGKGRGPRARSALLAALADKESWAEVIRIGVVEGLAALGDPTTIAAVQAQAAYGRLTRLRVAAIQALGTLGRRLEARDALLDALEEFLAERDVRIVLAAVQALRRLGDERGIALLEGAPLRHPDGRARRQARLGAERLRRGLGREAALERLGDEVARLARAVAEQRERIERLERRPDAAGPPGA